MFRTANRKIKTTCVSSEFALNLVKKSALILVTVAGRLQVIPLRVLHFRIQSGRTRNNITSVCVYIYYIANEQIAAMWHGLVVWLVKKETHTALTHHARTPVPSRCFPPSLFSPQYTHMRMHTHIFHWHWTVSSKLNINVIQVSVCSFVNTD